MLGVLGGPEVRQRLVDALPKLPNAAVRFVVSQVIDHHSPQGDAGLAAALRKVVYDGELSRDAVRRMGNAPFKLVIYRLDARAELPREPQGTGK